MQGTLRSQVFFPTFLLLIICAFFSICFKNNFLNIINFLHKYFLNIFGPFYSVIAFLSVLCCIVVYFLPISRERIGGEDAKPDLNYWQWFTLTCCSTIACGLLFWGTAEPLFHYFQPPISIEQGNANFSLASLMLHWTFTPYAIYTLPALLFALNFHNRAAELSFASCLYPLLNQNQCQKLNVWIDSFCLYSLVMGMATSLASGILILWGGLNHLFLLPKNPLVLAAITFAIVGFYVITAISGILKGMRILADLNMKLFLFIIFYVICCADLNQIALLSLKSFFYYIKHFLELSLWPNLYPNDVWGYQWSVFYWAIWMSWAPVVALFLGKIAKGYTVREFIVMNFFLPALFSLIWISLFGGLTLTHPSLENIYLLMQNSGPESIIYYLMGKMPFGTILIAFFIFTCYLSFVTAANANTVVMADISSTALDNSKEKISLKVIWGLVLGLISYLTVAYAGIAGIKILSSFSGLPVLIFFTLVLFAFVKLVFISLKKSLVSKVN